VSFPAATKDKTQVLLPDYHTLHITASSQLKNVEIRKEVRKFRNICNNLKQLLGE
jgi:hypothetical protein